MTGYVVVYCFAKAEQRFHRRNNAGRSSVERPALFYA